MLGNGMIWFNKSQNGCNILLINGVAEERVDQSSVGWSIGQQVVHPLCFNRPWMSGDNFEEFSELFGIDDVTHFCKHLDALLAIRFPILRPLNQVGAQVIADVKLSHLSRK